MNFCVIILFLICVSQHIDGTIVGGHNEVEVNDPDVIAKTKFALMHLNRGKGLGETQFQLIEIIKAARQVVSGTLTKLTLKVRESNEIKQCYISIWEQLWLNKTEILNSKCDDVEPKASEETTDKKDLEESYMAQAFEDFITKHNKVYADKQEYKKRYRIFRANLKKIKLLRETERGTAQYGITKFSDMTTKEFKLHLGLIRPENEIKWPMAEIPDVVPPKEFDWRDKNAVTPVKDQKSCGSCWAFSVTGNVEGQWALNTGNLLSLSEQELIDCDKLDEGCSGGYMTNAFKAIMDLGGLEVESDYPYDAKDEPCSLKKSEIRVEISGAKNLTTNETDIAKWLYKHGPVSAALNAEAMQFYFGGVSHPSKFLCDPNSLDHGILIVGYGVHHSRILRRTLPYWIIKNSWGEGWGERGYYKLYRGDGSCGINQYVSSAIVN